MTYSLSVFAITDRGFERERNEDAILVGGWLCQSTSGILTRLELAVETPVVLAVADGVGGGPGGEVASHVALHAIAQKGERWDSPGRVEDGLLHASAVVARTGVNSWLQGLATTIAGIVFAPSTVTAFNVGDSRIYRIADGAVEQLSVDDKPEARNGRRSNMVTQTLGDEPEALRPHIRQLPSTTSRYLICSAGVDAAIDDERFRDCCLRDETREIVHGLIDAVLHHGAPDNYSLLLVDALISPSAPKAATPEQT